MSEIKNCERCEEGRPKVPGFDGCEVCFPDRHECQVHKSFGLGACSYCLGMKLFEVRIFWNSGETGFGSSEMCKQVYAPNWREALECVYVDYDESSVTSVKVELLQTPEQREMEIKWSKWEHE